MNKINAKNFLRQNTISANKMFMKIVFCLNALGPAFIILKFLNIFHITYQYSFFVLALSLFGSILIYFLNTKCNNEKIVMYITLTFIATFVAVLAVNSSVGIYISYAMVSFLSCMYMDYKITVRTGIISYFAMLISLYFRSKTAYLIFNDSSSPIQWFIAMSLGFTMEFFFVLIVSRAITKLFRKTIEKLFDKTEELQKVQDKLIFAFADTVESSDSTTGAHIRRTNIYVKLIALKLREMGYYSEELTDELIDLYTQAAPLHDIGKISVPNNILSKPGRFTPEEFEQMKNHVQAGYDLIERNFYELEDAMFVKIAADMAYYHHEKWDGKGYPRGIKGKNIPICGRIMAAADVLDALLSKRQYKEPFSLAKTMEIFKESSGNHFEPCIAEAVISLRNEIEEIIKND